MSYSPCFGSTKCSFYLVIVLSLCIFPWCCRTTRSPQYCKLCPKQQVPAVFGFGDSIIDPGNNNGLLTVVKCNFPPYGKDFGDHIPTGRFSNGKIPTDFLAEELGVKNTLPGYLDPTLKEADLVTGVSFASSASGFDPMTSQVFFVKSMYDQLEMFKEYTGKVKSLLGVERTNFILNNSIAFVVGGSDDLVNTYFGTPFRSNDYDVDSYTDLMLNFATSFFENLYKLGLRRIGVSNLPPIGYLPSVRTRAGGPTREFAKNFDDAAQLFNSKLKDKLLYLSTKLPNSKLVYIDLYSIVLNLVLNNTQYGFGVVDRGCCGTGLLEVAVLCNPFCLVCEDDDNYIFWDSYHPTEKANQIIIHQVAEKYFSLFF